MIDLSSPRWGTERRNNICHSRSRIRTSIKRVRMMRFDLPCFFLFRGSQRTPAFVDVLDGLDLNESRMSPVFLIVTKYIKLSSLHILNGRTIWQCLESIMLPWRHDKMILINCASYRSSTILALAHECASFGKVASHLWIIINKSNTKSRLLSVLFSPILEKVIQQTCADAGSMRAKWIELNWTKKTMTPQESVSLSVCVELILVVFF